MQVNPDELPDVLCKCGYKAFVEGKTMKKLSEVHPANKAGKVQYLSTIRAICLKCFEPLPLKP